MISKQNTPESRQREAVVFAHCLHECNCERAVEGYVLSGRTFLLWTVFKIWNCHSVSNNRAEAVAQIVRNNC
jgi:hypothetical protein